MHGSVRGALGNWCPYRNRRIYSPEHKNDVNETTPLHLAVYKNDLSTVKHLIKLGANKNDKANNMTAIAYARSLGHHDLADSMIAKFAKEHYKRKHGSVVVPCTMFVNDATVGPTNTVVSSLPLDTTTPSGP